MINTYGLQYISQSKRYTIWILYNLTTFCANLGFPFSSSFFLQLSWKTVFGENWHRFLMDDALCISQPYTKALKETIQNGNEAFQEITGFPRALLQTDNHINTSSLNFYRLDALPDARQTVSKH